MRKLKLTKKSAGLAIGALFVLYLVLRPFSAGQSGYISSVLAEADSVQNTANSQTVHLPLPSYNLPAKAGKESKSPNIIDGATLAAADGITGPSDGYLDPSSADQISVYVVRKGDTLSEIAKMYGVSENTIRQANDMPAGAPLKEGEHLTILPISLDEEPVSRPAKKPAPALPSYAGYFADPLPGHERSQKLHGHNGIDMTSPCHCEGASILAAAGGNVILSKNNNGYNGGYGNYIVIAHSNGTQTLYAHLQRSLVVTGQIVARGQVIGNLGDTGKSTGPHLHFEVRGAKNPF